MATMHWIIYEEWTKIQKKTCIKNKSHDVEIRIVSQTKILFQQLPSSVSSLQTSSKSLPMLLPWGKEASRGSHLSWESMITAHGCYLLLLVVGLYSYHLQSSTIHGHYFLEEMGLKRGGLKVVVALYVPLSNTNLSHVVCPKFNSHVYKLKRLA